jgi:hypothetical protein
MEHAYNNNKKLCSLPNFITSNVPFFLPSCVPEVSDGIRPASHDTIWNKVEERNERLKETAQGEALADCTLHQILLTLIQKLEKRDT